MKNAKSIQFWAAFWGVMAILFVFPVIGLIWTIIYRDWKAFKLSLVMELPILILAFVIVVLMTAFHFVKKWMNHRKE
jgi:hypothetical protein